MTDRGEPWSGPEPAESAEPGESAELSDRLRQDVTRWSAVAAGGDENAISCLGDLLWYAGRAKYALEEVCAAAADRGDLASVDQIRTHLLRGLQDSPGGGISMKVQQREEERWLRRAAEAGSGPALVRLARLLRGTGRPEDAEQWLRRGTAAGDLHAMVALAELSARAGRSAEAERLLRSAIDAGAQNAPAPLSRLLRRLGRSTEADDVLRDAVADGSV